MIALWAEQDVVRAAQFRDGNVPAGTGNRRLLERAITALPPGFERILVRADSAAYTEPAPARSEPPASPILLQLGMSGGRDYDLGMPPAAFRPGQGAAVIGAQGPGNDVGC